MDSGKLYLVLNDCNSPVGIETKSGSLLVPGGTPDSPGIMPMMLDDIIYVNSTTNAFKIGLLHFEKEVEEEMQKTLRNHNWKNILTASEIEDIILKPTVAGLQRFININEPAYFERIRGIYIGLRNSGAEISQKVGLVIDARYDELLHKKFVSKIQLNKKEQTVDTVSRAEYEALAEQNKQMLEMIQKIIGGGIAPSESVQNDTVPEKETKQKSTATAKSSSQVRKGRKPKSSKSPETPEDGNVEK